MSRTPARQMATPEPSALDRDDIQEILSSFYLGDGTYSESGSEENEVYPSDSESATNISHKNRSHSHCGRDELEARELYDLYGDDESESGGRHDDDDGSDVCSSSSQDSDYDYPPDFSPTATECPTSLGLTAGHSGGVGRLHDRSSSDFSATYTKPKAQDLNVAFEGPEDGDNVVWGPLVEQD
ncbi:hypothetical protein AAF712_005132 [Marasmius tenuissimus]|uniref:Uncharacterized protein n=1 Tax=Marasmius tenuissimus TaxID=585030 RepID=A0ABR3A586_9AGAR